MVKDATLEYYCKKEPATLKKGIAKLTSIKKEIPKIHAIVGIRGSRYTSKAKKELDKTINFYKREIVVAMKECQNRKKKLGL